ncbi:hypothetical protein HN682_07915, partial [Candidatus Peregrinibacteria bacterium]|nr:hypothetical protein [Candidatus Peregrinibacteria bacterium]
MAQAYLELRHDILIECIQYRGEGIEHIVFDDKDDWEQYFMIEEGLLPTFEDNWRTAKQGSWTFADDGRVLQVLKKKDIKHPMDDKPWNEKWAPEGYVLTCVGSYVCKKKYWMDTDFSLRENRHSFGIPRTAETKKRSVRKRCSASELGFVMDVIAGLPIIIAYSNH